MHSIRSMNIMYPHYVPKRVVPRMCKGGEVACAHALFWPSTSTSKMLNDVNLSYQINSNSKSKRVFYIHLQSAGRGSLLSKRLPPPALAICQARRLPGPPAVIYPSPISTVTKNNFSMLKNQHFWIYGLAGYVFAPIYKSHFLHRTDDAIVYCRSKQTRCHPRQIAGQVT